MRVRLQLGMVFSELGPPETALEHLNAGLELARSQKQADQEGLVLFYIGKLQIKTEHYTEAQNTLKVARKIFQVRRNDALFIETERALLTLKPKLPRAGFRWPWHR